MQVFLSSFRLINHLLGQHLRLTTQKRLPIRQLFCRYNLNVRFRLLKSRSEAKERLRAA
jgi:hypothetical protein